MAVWNLRLRTKAILALLLACLLVMVPAGLVGQHVFEEVRNHFGEAYAVNFTLHKRQSILAPVARELVLSQRLADSVVTLQWLQDEEDAGKKALFFKEAERYRKDFRDQAYSIASAGSQSYYANDDKEPSSEHPRYVLSRDIERDSWFFSSLAQKEDYNINVDYDRVLRVTRVWFNVLVRDGDRILGVAGAGLDLSGFLKDFIATSEPGVTSIIISQAGAIQAHSDERLIAFNTAANAASGDQTLAGQLADGDQRGALTYAMGQAYDQPGQVFTPYATLGGKSQLLALSYIPELKWHVVTALDLQAAQVLDRCG